MATEKRELVLDLLARNKGKQGTQDFANDLAKLGTAAEKAGKSTETLGKKSDQTAKETAKLGRSATDAQGKVDNLSDEIRSLEQDLVLLAGAFADTQDKAERLDLAKGIRKSQAEIRRLTKTRGILEGLLPDPEPVALRFTARLGAGLSAGMGTIASTAGPLTGPVGAAIGTGIAVAALPALSTALVAGVGTAGLGAGVMMAFSKDKELITTAKKIGNDFTRTVQESASKAFTGPLRASFALIDDAADRSAIKIGKTFQALGPSLLPLTQDLVQAIDRILDSVTGLASRSGPALSGLGDSARLVADGVGDFLDALGAGANEGVNNLVMLSGAMADLVRWTGGTLKLFNDLANNTWVTGPLLPLLKKHYMEQAKASEDAAQSTNIHTDSMVNAQRAAEGELDALKGLSDELKAQSDPVFALLDAQDKLTEAQKSAADATKKHGKDSKEADRAHRDLAKAAIDLEGKVGALGETFNGELSPAMRATLKNANLTEAQIDAVEKQFRQARDQGAKYAKNYKANVSLTGYKTTYRSLYNVADIIRDIPRAVNIAMRVTGVTNVSKARAAINKQYEGRASGGPVQKDVPYWVGEEGPELVLPSSNGMVLNARQSAQFAGRRTGTSVPAMAGGGIPRVVLDVTGAEGKFKDMIRHMIRTQNLLQG